MPPNGAVAVGQGRWEDGLTAAGPRNKRKKSMRSAAADKHVGHTMAAVDKCQAEHKKT
jgi:hypothetical protein